MQQQGVPGRAHWAQWAPRASCLVLAQGLSGNAEAHQRIKSLQAWPPAEAKDMSLFRNSSLSKPPSITWEHGRTVQPLMSCHCRFHLLMLHPHGKTLKLLTDLSISEESAFDLPQPFHSRLTRVTALSELGCRHFPHPARQKSSEGVE